jgi:hypothetical protein
MRHEHVVHFLRGNLCPTTIDEFFEPAGEEQVVIGIQESLVACPEPTMRKGRTVRTWIILVAPHDVRAAHDDLSSLSGWQKLALSIHNGDF